MSEITELTDLQKRFCEEYLIDLNGTEAAKRAGYKGKSAASQASRLLTNDKISQYISQLKASRAEKTQTDSERVLQELRSIGFSNIKKVASWDAEGAMTVVPSEEMPDEVAASIESIKMEKITLFTKTNKAYNEDGEREDEVEETIKTTLTVKLHKKNPALLLIMRHIGMLGEKDEEENPVLKKALYDLQRGR